MRAIVNTAPGELRMMDLPAPEPRAGEVRIRTRACGVCVTDLEMIAGWDRTGFPSVPGHEWCGIVDAAGPGAPAHLAGRLCVAENVLTDGGEVGFEHPGGYGELLVTEARNLHVLPEGTGPAVAALAEPVAVAVRGVSRLGVGAGEGAVVFGDGPIGLLAVLVLARSGAGRVVVAGGRPERLELAREFGAAATVDYHRAGGALARQILDAFGGEAPPRLIEASGSPAAVDAALEIAAADGRIVLLGDYRDGRAGFRWNHVLHRELHVVGSNASAGAWPEAVEIVSAEAGRLRRLVTHRMPAERFAEAVDLVRRGGPGVVKVVLEWR